MSTREELYCPECEDIVQKQEYDRRDFIRVVGGSTAAMLAAGTAPALGQTAAPPAPRAGKPAEGLIRELYEGMSAEQRRTVVLPWDHGAGNNQLPTRLRMVNAAHNGQLIGDHYTPAQQELIERILRSISSGEDGFRQLTRGGTFDGSRSLQRCGSHIFGNPEQGQYSWVFSGHHLTVRCDGNSEPDAAFGGPMYYGHSPDGYSQRNIFNYQTRAVRSVFDALTEAQRQQAILIVSPNNPGEHYESVRFRQSGQRYPGLPSSELTADQKRLVEAVMREVISPFRREDGDEVMQLIRRNGGLDRIHIAFYRDREITDNSRWHFWRLEGPGFVWNYRILPHVHTYVNIAAARA